MVYADMTTCNAACAYTDWSEYSDCSSACGFGVQGRFRRLTAGNPDDCSESLYDAIICEAECPTCEVDGITYEPGCTIDCDTCGCRYCNEEGVVVTIGFEDAEVPGEYSPWTAWTECSSTCDNGVHTRSRTCDSPVPQCGGTCEGASTESMPCENMPECLVCTEVGTTEVTAETCERSCATRNQDPIELNMECLIPIGDEECTCAENFVRENGECIHQDECTNCVDEYGNVYEAGSSYSENCQEYQCISGNVVTSEHTCSTFCAVGLVYDPDVPNTFDTCCGSCVPKSEPGTACKLDTETKVLSTTDENGITCQTTSPIDVSYCKGGCDNTGGTYYGEIQSNGVITQEASTDCKCCSGTGSFEDVSFTCGFQTRQFQVKQMSSCSCNICGETAEESSFELNEAAASAPPPPDNISNLFSMPTNTATNTEVAAAPAQPAFSFGGF